MIHFCSSKIYCQAQGPGTLSRSTVILLSSSGSRSNSLGLLSNYCQAQGPGKPLSRSTVKINKD